MLQFARKLALLWRRKRIMRAASHPYAWSPADAQNQVTSHLLLQETHDQKLARLSRWCVTSRAVAAELELYEWQRSPQCPIEAVTLLVSLLSQSNRHAQALELIESCSQGPHRDDPALLCHQAALRSVLGLPGSEELIRKLHREHGHDPSMIRWINAHWPDLADQLPPVSEATIDQLAGELLDELDTIPSLVAAQRLVRDPRTILMLRGALSHALRDVDDDRARLEISQALAELAMMAGDHDDARRWAHRGLRIDPFAARLAIILSSIDDDIAIGPPASAVLKEAVKAHPKYPDLRAALIRREHAEGRIEIATRRLQQWLQREPNQRMAIRLQEELSAA